LNPIVFQETGELRRPYDVFETRSTLSNIRLEGNFAVNEVELTGRIASNEPNGTAVLSSGWLNLHEREESE